MDRAEILEKLKRAVRLATHGKVDPDGVSLESRLNEDLDIDSMALVELTLAVEEAFGGIHLPDERVEELKTVGQTVALLEELCR